MKRLDRRDFLQLSSAGMAALGLGCTPKKASTTSGDSASTDTDTDTDTTAPSDTAPSDTAPSDGTCAETSDNIEGPFYREDPPDRDMLDLYADKGTPVSLQGRVLDANCQPIPGAVLDFWQANPDGAYDLNTKEMRYYGRITADADGAWQFQSLVPGFYLNGTQYRPAHIHVKIILDGVTMLTTQLYFKGDPYIDIDPYVESDLIIDFTESDGALLGMFDFVLG
ncbi:MAG: protocatechuate 3,4-dioxygenase beta subunit [Myxococcota bacterium]|jgi:protocatechuate 3,4-dioxygenase beta subunit